MAYAIFAIVVIAAAAFAYFAFKGAPEQEHMKPEGLDAFRVTYNQEGMPIPLFFGLVRLPGNLLWYGNLKTVEVTDTVEGGKNGGGDQEVVTGYKYFLDHWQAVCMGPAYVHTIYVDNKVWQDDGVISPGTYTWYATYYQAKATYQPTITYNPNQTSSRLLTWSTGAIFKNDAVVVAMRDQIGEYANRLNSVAFAWWDYFLAGENRTFLPTVHYAVEKYSEVPITNANMSNGTNPAAIIYEILQLAGVGAAEIDLPSFQSAADYWDTKNYGLNMSITQQTTAREAIQNVFNYVDGVLYMNEDDQFVLKAFTESDLSVATITQDEFIEFSFERPSWDDVYSDFRAEYTDKSKDYSKRALRLINSAVRELTGYTRQMSVNLTAFRTVGSASRRLWEIARKQSYPASTIQFTTNMKYSKRNVGDVITVSHSDYGMVDAKFRILSKDMKEVDQNRVSWVAGQFLEGLFLDTYIDAGDPIWVNPDTFAAPAQFTEFFELPFNPVTGRALSWLALVQRSNLETGFLVRYSINGSDYYTQLQATNWSVRFNLDVTYPATTDDIDDDIGMILTPDYQEEDLFLNLSRSDLFLIYQIAVVGDEMMAFQYYQPHGSTQVKIIGIIRGLWNTPVQQHNAGAKVWLTKMGNNIVQNLNADAVSLKVLPYFTTDIMTDDVVPTFPVTITNKSLVPWAVGNIRAVRTGGTSITVTWWPTPQDKVGAGATAAENQDDQEPMEFDGDFVITDTYAEANDTVAGQSKSWVQSSQLQTTFSIQSRRDGNLSPVEQLVIPSANGTYWA